MLDRPKGLLPIDPLKILVINGQGAKSSEFSAMLSPGGFAKVLSASDESRAVESLRSSPVDLVILVASGDLKKGNAVLSQLRDPKISPQVGVLILMAVSDPNRETVARAIRLGADHVIRMPCDVDMLTKSIRGLIGKPPARISAKNYFGPCRRRLPDNTYTGPERRGDWLV